MKYFVLFFVSTFVLAQTPKKNSLKKNEDQLVNETDSVNFNEIKKVLKNDGLEKVVIKKKKEVKKIKKKRLQKKIQTFHYPKRIHFWSFLSEMWLVKNAQVLKWDFEKPDYGIDVKFEWLLKKLGFFEKTFKVLLINNPTVAHMGLPSNPDEYIFLLSVPFIRTMDLSKTEISLLLLEDFLRLEAGLVKKRVENPELKAWLGTNFFGDDVKVKPFKNALNRLQDFMFKKGSQGFKFDEQFQITRQMDRLLKSDLKLWAAYLSLIKKIDRLIKGNLLFNDYNKYYPSPELQIQWLTPKKTV